MKKIVSTLLVCVAFSAPIFAQDQDEAVQSSNDNTIAMHEHMQSMSLLMSELKKEKDPDVRQSLIDTHMGSMEKGMHMMNQTAGPGQKQSMSAMTMSERMEMMENHLGMMQMMMGQMIDHQVQAKSSGRPSHIKK